MRSGGLNLGLEYARQVSVLLAELHLQPCCFLLSAVLVSLQLCLVYKLSLVWVYMYWEELCMHRRSAPCCFRPRLESQHLERAGASDPSISRRYFNLSSKVKPKPPPYRLVFLIATLSLDDENSLGWGCVCVNESSVIPLFSK